MSRYDNTREDRPLSNITGVIMVMTDYDFVREMNEKIMFSRKGLFALFDYLEELSEETGEPVIFNRT